MTSKEPIIAIIGAGNMGSSLISGLLKKNYSPKQLWACDPSQEKRNHLQEKWGISVTARNEEAIQNAEVLIFALKPQAMEATLPPLATLIQSKKPLLISVAAGIREERIQGWLGGSLPLIRAMPNTPALIGCSATALYANPFTSSSQRAWAEEILASVGETVWLEEEKQMDAVTALSGSGPAYFFLLIEALQAAGQALGLSQEVTQTLSLQTAYGAACLALESKETVAELRQCVTSPQGTTESALQVLEEGGFKLLILKALKAAKKRSEELATH